MTASAGRIAAASRASPALPALATSSPAVRRLADRPRTICGSSSTTSTRAGTLNGLPSRRREATRRSVLRCRSAQVAGGLLALQQVHGRAPAPTHRAQRRRKTARRSTRGSSKPRQVPRRLTPDRSMPRQPAPRCGSGVPHGGRHCAAGSARCALSTRVRPHEREIVWHIDFDRSRSGHGGHRLQGTQPPVRPASTSRAWARGHRLRAVTDRAG